MKYIYFSFVHLVLGTEKKDFVAAESTNVEFSEKERVKKIEEEHAKKVRQMYDMRDRNRAEDFLADEAKRNMARHDQSQSHSGETVKNNCNTPFFITGDPFL